MATGFAAVQRNNVNNTQDINTVREKRKNRRRKEIIFWYRSAVRAEAVVTRKTLTSTY
ncbi:MAG: hypothetical protein CM15mV3_2410 [Caudoviricetes sp.]|nr:MAG: hypothetical protein CM15mV3_2410 [Caudoviricetes sp.]